MPRHKGKIENARLHSKRALVILAWDQRSGIGGGHMEQAVEKRKDQTKQGPEY